jgi:epoxyqueuosine reductase QueG
MSLKQPADPAVWISTAIQEFIKRSTANTLQNTNNEKAFKDPLVGFSNGADLLYEGYKNYVGAFHWTPLEIFAQAFPDATVKPDQLTVISWILPHMEVTKADNRRETIYPSERWARARGYGEEVNATLRKHVVATLQAEGYKAIAPQLFPGWTRKTSEHYGLASTWSERHAAYASGLGTFGLCDGLITPRGKAVRVGSVVANIQIPPSRRPYTNPHDYCLFFTQGICGKCILRCPVGAITEAGHDKPKCFQHVEVDTVDYVLSHFGFDGYGCGLCQTGVPCESKIPIKQEQDL